MSDIELGAGLAAAGDDYRKKDPRKKYAIEAARKTSQNILDTRFREIAESRGESAHVVDMGEFFIASTPEGVGTKSKIALMMSQIFPEKRFVKNVGIDTVSSIVNDLMTVGARPLVVSPHWAMGSNEWLDNEEHFYDLVDGWVEGCNLSGAIYGGGETPTLRGIVYPDQIELSGGGWGIIEPKSRLMLAGNKIKEGDHIVPVESSGIHCNAISLVRQTAEENLPDGFMTVLPSGKTLGEKILIPSHIYSPIMQRAFSEGIDLHATAHITGHGLSKMMRAPQDWTYRIHTLPPVPEELQLLQEARNLSNREAYYTYNMGMGFAFMMPEEYVEEFIQLTNDVSGFKSWDAGVVEKGPRRVILESLDIEYAGDTLDIR